jgi:hypothetical protein
MSWTCARCGAEVDAGLDQCWNCGSLADGAADPGFARRNDEALHGPRSDKAEVGFDLFAPIKPLIKTSEPVEVDFDGQTMQCAMCKAQRFWHRRAQLHTAFLTFLDLEWMNDSADCYVCDRCGYVHWFLPAGER